MAEFKLVKNSAQERFLKSRAPIQLMGGGFGNGKTALECVKVLDLAISYPTSRGVFARSTRPKLEDTIKPEFFKWCPADWIAKMPTEKHNDCILKNGSTVHFRHVRQEGKGGGNNTSNLLSATYDYAAVDQIDDPAFTHKDLLDLMGRLRGTTKYMGSDTTMPLIGPQWLLLTCNPTRNWVFKELVNPYHIFKRSGFITEKLIYDKTNKKCLLELHEADTYSNQHNTGEAYVRLLEAAYKGSMGKRFLQGQWGAYEGLIYPEYDPIIHTVSTGDIEIYVKSLITTGEFAVLEGYDHGLIVPSCYMLALVDKYDNTYIIDGIYQTGLKIREAADEIRKIRAKWNIIPNDPIYADPAIFRKTNSARELVGEAVSDMFREEGISMQRGNNSVESGIAKISSHLVVQKFHYNPIREQFGSAHLFFSSALEWLANEIGDYYWNKNISGDNVDKPRDVNDHAMDTLKYMFTRRPRIGKPVEKLVNQLPKSVFGWHEIEDKQGHKSHRLLN